MRHDALLLDAAGTLLHATEPVPEVYARIARNHGVELDAATVKGRFGAAMAEAAPLRLRSPDWREFWATVVHRCTGSESPALLDALVAHFRQPSAWRVAEGARACCEAARAKGMKLAVVSNWDHNLRGVLEGLGVLGWVDVAVISGEEGVEKPDPAIFERTLARLGVPAERAVHVGDSERADVEGARAAGCTGWLIGRDVADFEALAAALLAED